MTTNILEAMLDVFASVGNWISTTTASLTSMFYSTENGLTLLGVLAIASLAFSIVFLIIGLIQNFLHFRG